ncbi:MAG: GNAT family N-acetyltransferase [Fimbriimonas sp.]|nr:GNAT family N-acetyltransferase [Fimbriimonas sp.]
MNHAIRIATLSDAPDVWRLLRQFAVSYSPDWIAFQSTYPHLVDVNKSLFLVVEEESTVVGYLLGYVLPTLFANGPVLEIVELVVDEACRGKGLGKQLVDSALTEAWTKGCVEVVVPTRRAGAFYRGLGFAESATHYKMKRPA